LKVTIPANTTATIFVPAKDAATITEGGKAASSVDGVKFVKMEGNAAEFSVGSGSYEFSSMYSSIK
jgi:alpha-L-rhamnosidase